MTVFLNYSELRQLAQRRLPRGIFQYIDRGTEDEVGLRHNRMSLDAVRIKPRILTGDRPHSQAISLFGETYDAPMIVAPTAFAGLVWHQGEIALAKAASTEGVALCAATDSISSVEEIAAASRGPIWFQLYLWKHYEMTQALLQRAWETGVRTLVVTCDTAVGPNREYNARNGFDMPFRFSASNLCDAAVHPRWVLGVLARYMATGRLPGFANYPAGFESSIFAAGKALPYDRDLSWEHIRRLRDDWKGNLVLKGILRVDDALVAVRMGADGIVVSNHGGRNLDSAVAPIQVLAKVVDAVGGQITVIADSGVRRGSDVLKLLAIGARAVMLGRMPLYGAAVGGMSGASQAIRILRRELDIAMKLSGCRDFRQMDRSLLDMSELLH
ncbi:alpha-hydroxy acid oxidase [Bradyrhizobium sp. NBAIM01]|uniref:alpha-hydroxy acid oxidase n=1 Tax=Bradyrhizobium sp. NBAIM01 TaxID=2793818 RepID=UPI001CD312CB|nr:alpha-hydroxy acid oxidase [Bradyrhizobium sp. NBAIM01]MCA1510420.1 alpha-hydroxy-acid oxidizing protein [Bradyrhizobium sp. NBAIM01]